MWYIEISSAKIFDLIDYKGVQGEFIKHKVANDMWQEASYMIFDGRWKKELKHLSKTISLWKRFSVYNDFVKHQLTRAVLYSAIIVRKAIEDEREAEVIAKKKQIDIPKQKILHAELKAIDYPYVGEKGWAPRGNVPVMEYGKGTAVCLKSNEVCNWLVHSYHWNVVSFSSNNKCAGFLVASDREKEKCAHFISFDEWIGFLGVVIETGKF